MPLYKADFMPPKTVGIDNKIRSTSHIRSVSIVIYAKDDLEAQERVRSTMVNLFIGTGVDFMPDWYRL